MKRSTFFAKYPYVFSFMKNNNEENVFLHSICLYNIVLILYILINLLFTLTFEFKFLFFIYCKPLKAELLSVNGIVFSLA